MTLTKRWSNQVLLRLNTFAFRRVADLCTLSATSCIRELRQKLLRYAERQWITKSTVGPQRLSVRDNPSRTNNVLESFHSALRSRVKVAHPNVFAFLAHLQRATLDSQADVRRASRGMAIAASCRYFHSRIFHSCIFSPPCRISVHHSGTSRITALYGFLAGGIPTRF